MEKALHKDVSNIIRIARKKAEWQPKLNKNNEKSETDVEDSHPTLDVRFYL